MAARFPFFKTAQGTDQNLNLKGSSKAQRLRDLFPDGFVYAGDSRVDLPVWKGAKAAIVVSGSQSLNRAVRSAGIPIEHVVKQRPSQSSAWLRAIRPHQWAKNRNSQAP